MHPISRILQRNAARIRQQRPILAINPPADLPWQDWGERQALAVFTQDYSSYHQLQAAGINATFGVSPDSASAETADIILTLPREKARLAMWLDWAADVMPDEGSLWLAGENRAGIKSSIHHLKPRFAEVAKIDNACHCTLIKAGRPVTMKSFSVDSYMESWSCKAGGNAFEIRSLPGVFAHGKLDPATQMLIESLAALRVSGKVLDFGCGAGVIGIALKQQHAAIKLTLLDSNALALFSSESSLAANSLKATVVASDGFSDIRDSFDLIVTNPPFHRGYKAENTMSTSLLQGVRGYLRPGGQFVLVANRHLPYRHWLDTLFGSHNVLERNSQFHVLHAVQS